MKLGNDDSQDLAVDRVTHALSHPLRMRIARLLEHETASPAMLRDRIDAEVSPGCISYHFSVLRSYECIELVRVIPRQGADESLYRTRPGVARWIAAAGAG
ncbi:MAG: winged helix-turn-helix domain-containing protein [Solirubrobacterales bacterium]